MDFYSQGSNPYHAARARGRLLDLLIAHNIEFSFVMSPEFRAYQKELNIRAQEISDSTIKNNIMDTFAAAQKEIKKILKVRSRPNRLHRRSP